MEDQTKVTHTKILQQFYAREDAAQKAKRDIDQIRLMKRFGEVFSDPTIPGETDTKTITSHHLAALLACSDGHYRNQDTEFYALYLAVQQYIIAPSSFTVTQIPSSTAEAFEYRFEKGEDLQMLVLPELSKAKNEWQTAVINLFKQYASPYAKHADVCGFAKHLERLYQKTLPHPVAE